MEGFRDRAAGLRRFPFEAKDLPRTPNRRQTWSSRHHGHPLQQAGKAVREGAARRDVRTEDISNHPRQRDPRPKGRDSDGTYPSTQPPPASPIRRLSSAGEPPPRHEQRGAESVKATRLPGCAASLVTSRRLPPPIPTRRIRNPNKSANQSDAPRRSPRREVRNDPGTALRRPGRGDRQSGPPSAARFLRWRGRANPRSAPSRCSPSLAGFAGQER
jgi:hypothetical protein